MKRCSVWRRRRSVTAEEKGLFRRADEICLLRSAQILSAFQEYKVSTADFIEITGYGYYDGGGKSWRKFIPVFSAVRTLLCGCR